ncbi:MAG: hypothetical protein ABSA93_02150 [Streptosporangiaceae bacterium]
MLLAEVPGEIVLDPAAARAGDIVHLDDQRGQRPLRRSRGELLADCPVGGQFRRVIKLPLQRDQVRCPQVLPDHLTGRGRCREPDQDDRQQADVQAGQHLLGPAGDRDEPAPRTARAEQVRPADDHQARPGQHGVQAGPRPPRQVRAGSDLL